MVGYQKTELIKKIIKWALWIIAFLTGIVCALIVGFVLYWSYVSSVVPYKGAKFDKKIWMEAGEEGGVFEHRCAMTEDIVENYLHEGMSKAEVENLLGKIDHYFYCLDRKIKCAGYFMGFCSTTALGSLGGRSIYVCFDKSEKITQAGTEARPCGENNRALCYINEPLCTCSKTYETHTGLADCEVEKW